MSKPRIIPRDQERAFGIDELFFSTTDRKGVILSGNDVFLRVAGYSSVDDLTGKPHNIIRHPDMPRSVFKVFWDHLLADHAIAAYFKNIATDGSYYWVMALAVPTNHGFVSVRFKPCGPTFDWVKKAYAELLKIEAAANSPEERQASMERSGERFVEAIRELGHADYDEFMHHALAEEMAARERTILQTGQATRDIRDYPASVASLVQRFESVKTHLDELFGRAGHFLALITQLERKSGYLSNLSNEVHLLSLNAIISSHHLAEAGKGLAVVTHSLADVSSESTNVIQGITGGILSLITDLRQTAFAVTAAKLQVEMVLAFLHEIARATGSTGAQGRTRMDLDVLNSSLLGSVDGLVAGLTSLRAPVIQLGRKVGDLEEVLRTLSGIHILGKVEVSHVHESGHFLTIFAEVHEQLGVAKRELKEFQTSINALARNMPTFLSDGDSLKSHLRELAA